MSEVDLYGEEEFVREESPITPVSPEKTMSIQEVPVKTEVTPSPEKVSERKKSSDLSSKKVPAKLDATPDFMQRASVIPVKSLHSGESKTSYYHKEDYQPIDKALTLDKEQQDEADIYNWQNIINERLDRDSWSGGLGVFGKKKVVKQFTTDPESRTKTVEKLSTEPRMSSIEGPSIKEPSTRTSRTSSASQYSDMAVSYSETYLSESELATKSEICQTFKDRQNERTRRIALKMLDITESLAPSKYVMPVYRSTKYSIPVSMHTFKLNRVRLQERMKCLEPRGFILLKGGDELNQYNTDTSYTFRQEPFFHWAFGVRHTSYWGGLCLKSGKSYLFLPKILKANSVWNGKDQTPEEAKKQYGVSRVLYEEQMEEYFDKCRPKKIILLNGINSDSGLELKPPTLPFKPNIPIDTSSLYPVMCELRVIKNNYEIELIRQACIVSSDAHKYVMHSMAGMVGYYEYQAESLFLHYCSYMGGCRTTSYPCICGSGNNSSILHYGHPGHANDKVINDGDLCLFDMGCSYYEYASDITCTFPANGKFTKDQKIVYNAVLAARNRAIEVIRPGIRWDEIHLEALRALFTEMKNEALLFGNVQDMIDAELGSVFMPHGLGHLLGIDVHDVGGYGPDTPLRPTRSSLQYLRTNRILSPNMVITVEPGCYFIDQLLEEADENDDLAKFINFERINEYRGFGGVRIEDVILVTEFGCEILSEVPRTVEEIEAWMGSQVLEAGFDLGTEILPCLCAKVPPHISQLRNQGGEIIKGICGCDEQKFSSSSGATIHHDKSLCSERDSESEVFESEHFIEGEVEHEKTPEIEQPDTEEEEIDEEEQKYLKTKLAFLYSDSSSGSSDEIKTTELKPHGQYSMMSFSREFSKLKSGVDIYQALKKPPKAAPPTKPFTGLLSESDTRLKPGTTPKPPPPTPMSYLEKENQDLLIVHERKSMKP